MYEMILTENTDDNEERRWILCKESVVEIFIDQSFIH